MWNGSFEVNDARISMILSQLRKHNPQIFPCGAYYRESSALLEHLVQKTGKFEGFFFRKIIYFFRKILRKNHFIFTKKNNRGGERKKKTMPTSQP